MNEYHSEKFLPQYEHIKKLQLLTDEELQGLKKKRAHFEVLIRSKGSGVKNYLQYIEYERVLMKKFNKLDYENESDGRALDRALASHIRDIFQQAIKRFRHDRKLWALYLEFAKLKFSNTVSGIYQDMLGFHHSTDDYIEAVRYEMKEQNYYVAINFLIQGMNRDSTSKELVALNIECYLQQAECRGDEKFTQTTIQHVTKFYDKFLKSTPTIDIFIKLLKRIQNFKCSISFQNDIISHLLKVFTSEPELWNLLANRHLSGLFFEETNSKNPSDISFETRLRRAFTIYDKSLEIVDEVHKKRMYEIYLQKLEELESSGNISPVNMKYIKNAYSKTLISGYKEDCLTEQYFINYLRLTIFHDGCQINVQEVITKGTRLYPNSMNFYEVAIKYYYSIKNYEKLSSLFKQAIECNEKNAIELYRFLSYVFITNQDDKDRVKQLMMEAIKSSNKELSANFQPYILEYYENEYGIKKAREMYHHILKSKNVVSLSLEFFRTMIKIEKFRMEPDKKIIHDCFERAIMLFGSDNPEIWLEYIQYSHESENYIEATSIRKRALEAMKNSNKNIEEFELKYTLIKTEVKDEIKDEKI